MTTAPAYRRSFWQRVRGIPATEPPEDDAAWALVDGHVVIDLARTPQLRLLGGALRIDAAPDGEGVPMSLLVVRGDDGRFRAFHNACPHGGRCLDPVPGGGVIRCCSLGRSTFRYDGGYVSGPIRERVRTFPAFVVGTKLIVDLEPVTRDA